MVNWSDDKVEYYLSPCTTYSFYVAATNECGDYASSAIQTFTTKCENTVINSVESAGLKIFPNPAKEEIFIKSGFPVRKVEIYSLTGILQLLNNNFNEKISVSTLPKGIYIIKIHTENEVVIQKFTKE